MFLLRRPTEQFIAATIEKNRSADFSYQDIGWTQSPKCPKGFTENRWSAVIAEGKEGFEKAKLAIRAYKMLQLGWLQHVGPCEPIEKGSHVATLARESGIYSLNVARIVYAEDESPNRFGFGYGTLPEYPLSGEERFTVELDNQSGEVRYEIFSFSRPRSLLSQLSRPIIRRAQQRFYRDSTNAMQIACRE